MSSSFSSSDPGVRNSSTVMLTASGPGASAGSPFVTSTILTLTGVVGGTGVFWAGSGAFFASGTGWGVGVGAIIFTSLFLRISVSTNPIAPTNMTPRDSSMTPAITVMTDAVDQKIAVPFVIRYCFSVCATGTVFVCSL